MHRQLINLAVRGLSQACRLLLLLALARFLLPEELGMFGLVFAIVNYGLMIAGLDLYAFANRKIVDASPEQRRHILENQATVYCVAYAVILPSGCLLVLNGLLSWKLYAICGLLLVAEHLSYEVYRVLNAIGRPFEAVVGFFIRAAAWVPLLLLAFIWVPALQTLETVFALWLLGTSLSVVFGLFILARQGLRITRPGRDLQWMKTGLVVALPYIFGTLALRGMFTADRFLVEEIGGLALLGAYTFYAGIAVTMVGLLESAVFSFTYPRLVEQANRRDMVAFSRQYRSLALQTLVGTVAFIAMIIWLSPYLMNVSGHAIYAQNSGLLHMTLIAFGMFCLGMVPHYGLFALRADKSIMFSHLFGILAFLLGVLFFSQNNNGVYAVPYAMITGFTVILIAKVALFTYKYSAFKATGPAHV